MADNFFINNPNGFLPKNNTNKILRESNALAFHQSLKEYQPTPLIDLPNLAKKYNVKNIFVKDDSPRFGLNAFKGLGASYAIYELLKSNKNIETFCTATDGNHGRAVAWSAQLHNKKAVVYMPKGSAQSRKEAIESYGGKVIVTEFNYEETCDIAAKISLENNWQLVQDTAWDGYEEIPAYIMAGYLTHFIELEITLHTEEEPKVDFVFLQAGVGSWAAAAIWYYVNRYAKNKPKLIIIEPTNSNGILESFKQNKRAQPTGNLETIMAGLNCGIPSSTAWEVIKNNTDFVIAIDDEYAKQAMRNLYFPIGDDAKITAGESGAAGLAGFIALMNDEQYLPLKNKIGINNNSSILFYSTEGATDRENFEKIIGIEVQEKSLEV